MHPHRPTPNNAPPPPPLPTGVCHGGGVSNPQRPPPSTMHILRLPRLKVSPVPLYFVRCPFVPRLPKALTPAGRALAPVPSTQGSRPFAPLPEFRTVPLRPSVLGAKEGCTLGSAASSIPFGQICVGFYMGVSRVHGLRPSGIVGLQDPPTYVPFLGTRNQSGQEHELSRAVHRAANTIPRTQWFTTATRLP